MTSVATLKREVEKIRQQVKPKHKSYIKLWMADCMIKDRERIIDTKIDEQNRKWAAIKVGCIE